MRSYRYVGPPEIREAARDQPPGQEVRGPEDLAALAGAEGGVLTYVVSLAGVLRVADRRSEHVACAGGAEVLAAGELELAGGEVVGVSNQSTGYCPESSCWGALAAALDAVGVSHPGRFTRAFEFRRCEACGERNLVKDQWFVCSICEAELPSAWNF